MCSSDAVHHRQTHLYRAFFASVEKRKIGSVIGKSMAGVGGDQTERILSRRHPKRLISKVMNLVFCDY
jgi:hypothetical protein